MDIKEKFMHEALKEATKALKKDEVPIGAVIVKDDKIIARGHNLRENKQNSLCHAEIIAISKACRKLGNFRLEDCDLYVTVEPCPMCAGAIIQSRIKNVYYGTPDNKYGAVDSVYNIFEIESNHKVNSECGILKEECSTIIKDFFKELRNRNK